MRDRAPSEAKMKGCRGLLARCQPGKARRCDPPRGHGQSLDRPFMRPAYRTFPRATLSLLPCQALARPLPAAPWMHSHARGGQQLPWTPRDNAGSPSAIYHDITCQFVTSNSPNSRLSCEHKKTPTEDHPSSGGRSCGEIVDMA